MNTRSVSTARVWPEGWKTLLGSGPIGVGIDPATTTEKKSNPTAIAVTEKVGLDFIVRALVRYKTSDPEATEEILRSALTLPGGRRVRKVCIDATSEKFFATALRRSLAPTPFELVVFSKSVKYLGEDMLAKVWLGNLLVNTLDEGHLLLPSDAWIKDDFRQVRRERGSFEASVDESGNHADGFTAVMLSLAALVSGSSSAVASAAQVGTFGARRGPGLSGLKNPLASLYFKGARH